MQISFLYVLSVYQTRRKGNTNLMLIKGLVVQVEEMTFV